jgi:putative membrane protein
MKRKYATAVALSLALCACGEAGDSDRQTAGQKLADAFSPAAEAATPTATSDQAFARAIAGDDAYELAAVKLAERMSGSEEIRLYAAQMVQDHAVAVDELHDALEHTHGVTADGGLSPDRQRALDELRKAGDRFDREYARQEIAAHEQELATLRDYADNGMDPALSEFAAGAANMAADHLRLARKLF